MLVRPIGMKPAARRRATDGASRTAGCASLSAREPAMVTSPARSNRSLIETGMPANGEGAAPAPSIAASRRRERVGSVDLGNGALALRRAIADPRQALLDEAAARAAAPEIGRELGERSHRSRSSSPSLVLQAISRS